MSRETLVAYFGLHMPHRSREISTPGLKGLYWLMRREIIINSLDSLLEVQFQFNCYF